MEQRHPIPWGSCCSSSAWLHPGQEGFALTLCIPTGVRDYIHVVDLAKGHIAALKKLKENCGCKVPRELLSGVPSALLRLGQGWAFTALGELKRGLALLPFQKKLIYVPYPPPRSTIWVQAPVIPSCRWSRPWRKLRGGR